MTSICHIDYSSSSVMKANSPCVTSVRLAEIIFIVLAS